MQTDSRRVDDLVRQWETQLREGQFLSTEELCSDCPELISEVRQRIEELRLTAETQMPNPDDPGACVTVMEPAGNTVDLDTLVIKQTYRKMRFHARGGLGEIYVADDAVLERDVVVKFMRKRHCGKESHNEQFALEAAVTAKLDHPGVVPVYGYGRSADGRPCYAMRFIQGVTLEEKIARLHSPSEPLSSATKSTSRSGSRPDSHAGSSEAATTEQPQPAPKTAHGTPYSASRSYELHSLLARFVSVCKTLAYAHNRGIVHRDIKPENIMLGKYGDTLVVDWGLAIPVDRDETAKASGEETLMPSTGSNESSSHGPVGTPAYMSPEQANGLPVRPSSDIFSLGATLYKLLTGHSAYSGDSVREVLKQARCASYERPRAIIRQIPRPLEAICLKAMAAVPAHRYQTAMELADDIDHWLADEPIVAYRESPSERLARWIRQHRVLTQSIVSALFALSVVVMIAAVGQTKAAKTERSAKLAAQAAHRESLQLAAQFVARSLTKDIQSRWLMLEKEAASPVLAERLAALSGAEITADGDPLLQNWLHDRRDKYKDVAPGKTWFVLDATGRIVGGSPKITTMGGNFGYRDYFNGLGKDLPPTEAGKTTPIKRPHRSITYRSKDASREWVFALSVPILAKGEDGKPKPIGVLALSQRVGDFPELKASADSEEGRVILLVDTRPDEKGQAGTVLHDTRIRATKNGVQETHHIPASAIKRIQSENASRQTNRNEAYQYVDDFNGEGTAWIAEFEPVFVNHYSEVMNGADRHEDTGWVVVVQTQAQKQP